MSGTGIIKNYDSWIITLSKKQKRISIETVDYHAGPLILNRDELADLARIMGLRVGKRKRKKHQHTST